MKKLILFLILVLCFNSCKYDELPAGKAVVTSIKIRNDKNTRIYKVVLEPLNAMDYVEVEGIWSNTEKFIIYTDSLLHVGDTIDILK